MQIHGWLLWPIQHSHLKSRTKTHESTPVPHNKQVTCYTDHNSPIQIRYTSCSLKKGPVLRTVCVKHQTGNRYIVGVNKQMHVVSVADLKLAGLKPACFLALQVHESARKQHGATAAQRIESLPQAHATSKRMHMQTCCSPAAMFLYKPPAKARMCNRVAHHWQCCFSNQYQTHARATMLHTRGC